MPFNELNRPYYQLYSKTLRCSWDTDTFKRQCVKNI